MPTFKAQRHRGWIEVRLEQYASFDDCWDELESCGAGGDIRVALLTGRAFANASEGVSQEQARRLERFELPTVFAFAGLLEGAALNIALSCDIRICAADASLRVPVGNRRTLALIGPEASADLFAVRGKVDAEMALAAGLVSRVARDEAEAVGAGRELAAVIASRGPIATRLGKEAIWHGLELPLEHALRFETDLTLLLQTTKDRAEGVSAFLEKRQPNFTGE